MKMAHIPLLVSIDDGTGVWRNQDKRLSKCTLGELNPEHTRFFTNNGWYGVNFVEYVEIYTVCHKGKAQADALTMLMR